MSDSTVTRFSGRRRRIPDEGTYLRPVVDYERSCQHELFGFDVDESEDAVTCRKCGTKLNPVWAMARLARQETGWHRTRADCSEILKKLDAKSRCKCQHCGQMTRVRP